MSGDANEPMRNRYRFTDPPGGLRRRHVRLDNIALLPGAMLPFKETWEKIAGNLPEGSSLIVLPPAQSPQRAIYVAVARRMQARGKSVRLISAEQVIR
jgi:hypothetical protein